MATAVPKSVLIAPTKNTWAEFGGGKVFLGCPKADGDGCYETHPLDSGTYTIAANGDVTPAFDCPDCDYDELITLTDWVAP